MSSFVSSYGTYDAATGIYKAQTQQEFDAALMADIAKALGMEVIFPKPAVKPAVKPAIKPTKADK